MKMNLNKMILTKNNCYKAGKKITVKAAAFSASAKEKIEQAGGKAEVV